MNTAQDEIASQKLAIAFLKGIGKDNRGRTVNDYFSFNETTMEYDHEWIQWAFPISTVSPHNPNAGRIFRKHNADGFFKCGSPAYVNQQKLLVQYLDSIGIVGDGIWGFNIDLNKFWVVVNHPFNHHMKRISRVLKHLQITGSQWIAYIGRELYQALMIQAVRVNPYNFDQRTLMYWAAVGGKFDNGTDWF